MEAFLKGASLRSKTQDRPSSSKSAAREEKRLVPWVEKYRPKAVDEIAYQDEVVSVLKRSLQQSTDLPNLLFYGPPGTGKTSAILAVSRELYGPELMKTRVLELNASDERGIQVIREKVKSFAQKAVSSTTVDGKPCPPFKIIILDEADSMTSSAQAALRRTMEKESKTTRFCLICNYISRIIEPLTSRCSKFRFKPLSEDILTSRLEYIAKQESVSCQPAVISRIVEVSEGDLRKAITFLQSVSRLKGSEQVTEEDILEIAGVIPTAHVDLLMKVCFSDSYESLQSQIKEIIADGYGASQMLSQLHDKVVSMENLTDKQKSIIAERMGLVDKRLMDGADEFLQLMDLCSVIMHQLCHAPS